MAAWWRLDIELEGGVTKLIVGTEQSLRESYNEWKDMDGKDIGPALIEIHGISDSADRAESNMLILRDSIKSMTLLKLWGA